MSVCPSGHDSASDDYCDVCGLPIPDADASAGGRGGRPGEGSAGGRGGRPGDRLETPSADSAPADPAATACPNCQATNPPNALFCEACGYDFTTGSMPRPFTPPTIDSVLDLDRDLDPATADAKQQPADTPLAPALKDAWVAEVWIDPDWYADQESSDPLPSAGVPTVVPLKTMSILVGRTSRSRGIHPDIDLGTDNGISRRHCQLTTDGTRWWVEDLGSSNGTYLGSAVGSLPDDPIPPGEKREIGPDGRVYLGAWTRVVVRKATPGEF